LPAARASRINAAMTADRIFLARALHRSRIGALLRLAARGAVAATNAALAAQGLSHPQLEVLAGVAAQPGEDQLGIASRLGMDRSSMATLAQALEEAGLLVRTPGADRRRKLLRLGPAGQGRLTRGLKAAQAAETALLAPLGEDAAPLRQALETLATHHAELAAAPAPLHTSLTFLLRRLAQAANARFVAEGGADQLGGLDYSILTLLAEGVADDQASLIEAISTSRSSTIPAIARLLRAGLIARDGDPADRRRKPLAISAAGRARIAGLAGAVARYEKAFLAPLSAAAAKRLHGGLARLTETIA
jgi:DNA-binding MarR family transcriptional regulator